MIRTPPCTIAPLPLPLCQVITNHFNTQPTFCAISIDNGFHHSNRQRDYIRNKQTRLLIIVFVTGLIEPAQCRFKAHCIVRTRIRRTRLLCGRLFYFFFLTDKVLTQKLTFAFGRCRLHSSSQLLSPPDSCNGSGSIGNNSTTSPYAYSALPTVYQNNATGAETFSNVSSSFLPQPLLWNDRSMSDYRQRVPAL